MQVETIPIPTPSLIEGALPRTDYADAYAVTVPGRVSPEVAAVAFFRSFPAWFTGLMYVRESLASLAGLKTARGMDVEAQLRNFTGRPGESIALFHVLDRSEEEILSGENDRHLDFRLSFFAQPRPEGTRLILATTVRFNGWPGRAYFLPVRPVHRLAVPVLLKRTARRLQEGREKTP